MTKPNNWDETVEDIFNKLILEIGEQVTDDYKSKHGLWEGMSIRNVRSREKAVKALNNAVKRHVIEAKVEMPFVPHTKLRSLTYDKDIGYIEGADAIKVEQRKIVEGRSE